MTAPRRYMLLLLTGAGLGLSGLPAWAGDTTTPPAVPVMATATATATPPSAPALETTPAAAPFSPFAPATPPDNAPPAPPGGKQPIDINADQTLEWHRDDQQYIARGHVVATQGNATIKADTITADYRKDDAHKGGAGAIYQLTAVGHVILISQGNQAFGDKAIYNVDTGKAIMTGQHLVMNGDDGSVTARDNFLYDNNAGEVTANGAARLVRPTDAGADVITADTLSAWFAQKGSAKVWGAPQPARPGSDSAKKDNNDDGGGNGKGKSLDHATADGHVVLTTPTEIMHGDHGTYDNNTQIAVVTGHVRIDRGPNVLTGDRAQVNLQTNVSQMIVDPKSGHQVHALFYPDTQDETSGTTDQANLPTPEQDAALKMAVGAGHAGPPAPAFPMGASGPTPGDTQTGTGSTPAPDDDDTPLSPSTVGAP